MCVCWWFKVFTLIAWHSGIFRFLFIFLFVYMQLTYRCNCTLDCISNALFTSTTSEYQQKCDINVNFNTQFWNEQNFNWIHFMIFISFGRRTSKMNDPITLNYLLRMSTWSRFSQQKLESTLVAVFSFSLRSSTEVSLLKSLVFVHIVELAYLVSMRDGENWK